MKKYSGLRGVLGLCLFALSAGAWAQDIGGVIAEADVDDASADEGGDASQLANANDRRLYFSPMFSYTLADSDRRTDDGIGGAVSLGKKMTSGLNLELTGFFTRMDGEEDADDKAQLTGVGLGAMIFPSTTFATLYGLVAVHQASAEDHPSVVVGTTGNYKTTVADFGVGYLFPLNQFLGGFQAALRTEARYRMDSHHEQFAGDGGKDEFYEFAFNVGLLIPLGKLAGEPAAEVEVVPAASGDADNDGIPDDADQCPDTPAGATVNETGCENDADGDGVVDRLDTCPDTAAGTSVDEKGCAAAADKDGDGVPDALDQCPDTAAGTTVNETGCEAKSECRAPAAGEPIDLEGCASGEAVVLKGVNFEVNSSRLTANAKVILNQVADSLAAQPGMKVEIGGHTDAQGSDSFNLKLSERRAQAVKDYLIARGIAPERLLAKGYGESQAVDSNETPEGREINRRVEMKVLESGG
jgi:OmpA-OmpF porin, OOP family